MVIIIAIKVYNCYRMHLSLFHAMIKEFVCVGRDGGGEGGWEQMNWQLHECP